MTALRDFTKRGSLALVGHEPGLGELAAALLGLRGTLTFKKGGAMLIDVSLLPPPAGSGELVWMVTPRILRGLGTESTELAAFTRVEKAVRHIFSARITLSFRVRRRRPWARR